MLLGSFIKSSNKAGEDLHNMIRRDINDDFLITAGDIFNEMQWGAVTGDAFSIAS